MVGREDGGAWEGEVMVSDRRRRSDGDGALAGWGVSNSCSSWVPGLISSWGRQVAC